jgi:outer membrane protein assembly factor BamB
MPYRNLSLILFTAFWISWQSPAARADDWPGWRGPTGMGQSPAKGLPLSWGGKGQEHVAWKVPLFDNFDKIRRDQNQSSPIVAKGRVFVTVSYWPEGVSDKEYPEHHVVCFDAADGSKLWDKKVPPGPWLLKDLRGGYTAPTPASDGERVYVVFGSAVIAALDFQGKLVWRKEITPFNFDVAIGASPIVYKDTVLFLSDQIKTYKSSSLTAYDAKTGAVHWQQERSADWAHSTPALALIKDKMQLLVGTANGPQGLDPDNGKILWSFTSADRVGDTVTPVYGGGLVYCDSGRGGPGVAVDPTGAGDVTKTNLKWKIPTIPEGFSSPVIVGDLLFRAHSPGVVTCRKLADGSEVIKKRFEGLDQAVSPVATADGRLYFATAGKSFVLKAGPALDVLGTGDLGDFSRAAPAVAGNRLYLKGGRYLFCVGG